MQHTNNGSVDDANTHCATSGQNTTRATTWHRPSSSVVEEKKPLDHAKTDAGFKSPTPKSNVGRVWSSSGYSLKRFLDEEASGPGISNQRPRRSTKDISGLEGLAEVDPAANRSTQFPGPNDNILQHTGAWTYNAEHYDNQEILPVCTPGWSGGQEASSVGQGSPQVLIEMAPMNGFLRSSDVPSLLDPFQEATT